MAEVMHPRYHRAASFLSMHQVCLLQQNELLLLLDELLLSNRRLIFRFSGLQFPGFGQSTGIRPDSQPDFCVVIILLILVGSLFPLVEALNLGGSGG
jgi:hypothetical protein